MHPKHRLLSNYARHLLLAHRDFGVSALGELGGVRVEAAAGAMESALNDRSFRRGQDFALEAIVLPRLRPTAFIQDGTFADLPDPWRHVGHYRDPLRPVIASIGRLEVSQAGVPFGGTGWLCGEGLILTNRHVAELFTYGVGTASRLRFIPQRQAFLETAHEHPLAQNSGLSYRLTAPVMIHPHWDVALLKVEMLGGETEPVPKPLTLCSTPPDPATLNAQEVVVIGYPYWSDYHDPEVMQRVFDGVYGVKRLQPGKLMGYESITSYHRQVDALLHDASTLGGNSGSAVVDLVSQQVIALHFAGTYLVANYSVPTWELARDPRLVDAGVNFAPRPPGSSPTSVDSGAPGWLSAWHGREDSAPEMPADRSNSPASSSLVTANVEYSGLVLDPGWMERYSDDELRRLYQRAPDAFRSLLAISCSAGEAQQLYDTLLFDASVEGVSERSADPSLPELVILPGILGSHLDRPGWQGRAWLNPLTLPFQNLLSSLGLDPNGHDRHSLQPDGLVRATYSNAARNWRRQGFVVHEFSYDWRIPLAHSASKLDQFLRARRSARREARFALVAHSMGGLVACVYARQTPDWRDFVEHTFLCGCPLGGSFAIMQILSGENPLVRKLAGVSLGTSITDLQALGATLPGALELLPHPNLFSRPGEDVEVLYRPDSYPAGARPGADWLRSSREIKDDLRTSPLLGRATTFISLTHPTDASFEIDPRGHVRNGRHRLGGDGTVTALSARIDGVPAYETQLMHSDLLHDPVVLEGVPDILSGKRPPLPLLTEQSVRVALPEGPAGSLEALTAKWENEAIQVRERMRDGLSTQEDLRWLLRTD